jgi:curli biogenesis system outer membrane secretion channel CsgG
MKRRKFLLSATALIILVFNQPSFGQLFGGNDFFTNTIRPPELFLENTKKIAVLNFNDDNNPNSNYWSEVANKGSRMADLIVANLLQDSYGLNKEKPLYIQGFRTNIFTVVERSQLDNVLKEQKLGVSGAIADSEASQAGKLLGIDVIISGSVAHSHNDSRSSSSEKNSSGVMVYSYVAKRLLHATARVKFIKVSTGEVISVKEFSSNIEDAKSNDKNYPFSQLTPADQMADMAFTEIAKKITEFVEPTYQFQELDIFKIKSKEYKDRGKEAVENIKAKRIDKALLIYNSIYEKDSYNQETANNLAVLYEGTGNYEKALEFYKISAELNPDQRAFKEGVTRSETLVKMKKYLEAIGINIVPYEFAAAGSGSSKLADKVTTKGRTKDRYDVREAPDASSAVVAKVPGDTEFEVIEKSGTWTKIKLLGGKSGYIESSQVR